MRPRAIRRFANGTEGRAAAEAAVIICERGFMAIRASAHLRRPVDAPPEYAGDYVEWIRLLADACDGLARTGLLDNADEVMEYRRAVWNPVQTAWVESVLAR